VLVVGPSGVGKDTLLDGARAALAHRSDIVFVQRDITRPRDAGGEQHAEVSGETFAARVAAGHYALHWQANGHGYGIPRTMADALAAGATVVVNGSRGVIDEARTRFGPVVVALVTARPETLRARLLQRGRESAAEIDARVARAALPGPSGADVVVIANDADPKVAIIQLVALIAPSAPAPR
jgi:phosphonate metabolism protein PhnN/1,5-bisphosphokinase (PRPP-forming)